MFNFVGLIVFLIGLGFVIVDVILLINSKKSIGLGFVVDMIVKSVEELTRIDENGGNIVAGYKVTFEFNYNGQTKIETLCLNEKPSINKKIKGLYDPNKSSNSISLLEKNKTTFFFVFLLLFGVFWLICGLYIMLNFSTKIFIKIVGFYVIVILLFLIIKIIKNKSFHINENISITDDDVISAIPDDLVRYIPEYKAKKIRTKLSFGSIFLSLIFISLGLIFLGSSFNLAKRAFHIKYNYSKVEGVIKNTYLYSTNSDEEENLVGVLYEYEVNGIKYELDYKTGISANISNYNIGDKMNLYYNEKDPRDALPKKGLGSDLIPLMMSVLFIYISIFIINLEMKKISAYKRYVYYKGEEK